MPKRRMKCGRLENKLFGERGNDKKKKKSKVAFNMAQRVELVYTAKVKGKVVPVLN
jgi:hypothetical protein